MTENEAIKHLKLCKTSRLFIPNNDVLEVAIKALEEIEDLKEKNNKDFELLLKSVKESYPMFKGAYVELDVFMGDVMRRFARDRKET